MDKKELRKIYKEKRKNISYSERTAISEKIKQTLVNTEYYRSAKKIFTFVNTSEEIITEEIIKYSWENGKEVAVPVMTGAPHEMVFIKLNSFAELRENKYGIREPILSENNILKSDDKTIILVPALAIGKNMYRVGYGGGFYDKYLKENIVYKSIGICMDFQLLDDVPFDKLDQKIDLVISDKRIIKGDN